MDEDTLTDLKQFITSTMSQQLALQSDDMNKRFEKLEQKLSEQIDNLDTKVNTIANTIGVQMEEDKTSVHETLKNHETRITKLEQKPA